MAGGLFIKNARGTPAKPQEDALSDAVRWGMGAADRSAIGAATGATGGSLGGGVWVQNREIVEAFLAVSGQWRTGLKMVPGAGLHTFWLGLDYAGAAAGLELAGIDMTPRNWAGVRVMEEVARRTLNEEGR